MVKILVKMFRASIIRYNYNGIPIYNITKDYKSHPSEKQLLTFLNKQNMLKPEYRNHETSVTINKIYLVATKKKSKK